jgi:transaldolase
MNYHEQAGCPPSRVLVKVPATWEGIEATRQLEAAGVRCLVTLVTSTVQARAVMDAGATILATCKCKIYYRIDHTRLDLQGLRPEQFCTPKQLTIKLRVDS